MLMFFVLFRPLRLSADAGSGRHLLHDEEHQVDGLQPLVERPHKDSAKISGKVQFDHG